MEPGVLQNILLFLTDTLLSLYVLVFLLRFLLVWVQADFHNPLSQAVFRLTQPPIRIVRRIVPPFRNIDLSSLAFAYALKVLSFFLLGLIHGMPLRSDLLFIIGAIKIAEVIILIYIFALIILAVSSWLLSGVQAFNNPLISLLYSLSSPIMTRVRRIVPNVGIVDFSPLVVLIGLYLLYIILRSLYHGQVLL